MSTRFDPAEQELRARLEALREDPPDAGFELGLHRRLVEAGAPEPASWWNALRIRLANGRGLLWPVAGVAAGVLTFLLLSSLHPAPVAPGAPSAPAVASAQRPVHAPGTRVPASKVAVIKLDFAVNVAVEQADFQVTLPDGLYFWADGRELPERSFQWTQPLSEGNNIIPIAVRGQKPGRYLVAARATVDGQEIEHDVLLEVTQG